MKKLLLIFTTLLIFLSVTGVKATECTYEELKELKALARKVEIGYVYDEKSDVFNLNIYNLSDKVAIETYDFYFDKNVENFNSYVPGESVKIIIIGGKGSNCYDEYLNTIKFKFPVRNYYYGSEICNKHEDYDFCKKWYDTSKMSSDEFTKKIKEKFPADKTTFETILNFIVNNYIYLIILAVVIAISIVIFRYVKNKNKKIDL